MIYLGIDLGDRRVGLAIADSACPVATPLGTCVVRKPAEITDGIKRAYLENHADLAVIGLPLAMTGRKGDKAKAAEIIAAQLRADGLKVELWDERLTTEEVRKTMIDAGVSRKNRGAKIDALAAQRILSSFLSAHDGEVKIKN